MEVHFSSRNITPAICAQLVQANLSILDKTDGAISKYQKYLIYMVKTDIALMYDISAYS